MALAPMCLRALPPWASFSYFPPLFKDMGTLDPAVQVIDQPVVCSCGDSIISITGLNYGVPVYRGAGAWSLTERALAVGQGGWRGCRWGSMGRNAPLTDSDATLEGKK